MTALPPSLINFGDKAFDARVAEGAVLWPLREKLPHAPSAHCLVTAWGQHHFLSFVETDDASLPVTKLHLLHVNLGALHAVAAAKPLQAHMHGQDFLELVMTPVSSYHAQRVTLPVIFHAGIGTSAAMRATLMDALVPVWQVIKVVARPDINDPCNL